MDSGSAVPTLSPGLRDTVAEKLLTVARVRWGGAGPLLAGSGDATGAPAEPLTLRPPRSARFLAALRLGRRIAAITARTTTTTSSSINVNARHRMFTARFQSTRC